MLQLLERGEAPRNCLSSLHHILAGGCALNEPLLRPLLERHGVRVWPHYGQTEVGGAALVGGLPGSLRAMQPLRGVRYVLVDQDGAERSDEGELVLALHDGVDVGSRREK